MSSCLNCGKNVANKFCDVSCQNLYKKYKNNELYNICPLKCNNCDSLLQYDKRNNKFCSASCSAKKNNIGKKRVQNFYNKFSDSEIIDKFISSSNISDFIKNIGYKSRPSSNTLANIKIELEKLGLSFNISNNVLDMKKGDLFNNRSNWQSARSAICKSARKIFNESDKLKECAVCGYSIHYDVAHRKAVSVFDDDCLIYEINHIDNLIALCKNHHWEYDNNLLKI